MIPMPSFELDIPGMLVKSPRTHNTLIRRALRACLEYHWRHRIPLHFTKSAASRYSQAPRKLKYMKYKARRYHSTTNLVKTGRTRADMTTRAQFTMRGAAAAGTVQGDIKLRFPFSGAASGRFKKESHQKVNILQMQKEIRLITQQEAKEIGKQLLDNYIALVEVDTTPRQRIKIP